MTQVPPKSRQLLSLSTSPRRGGLLEPACTLTLLLMIGGLVLSSSHQLRRNQQTFRPITLILYCIALVSLLVSSLRDDGVPTGANQFFGGTQKLEYSGCGSFARCCGRLAVSFCLFISAMVYPGTGFVITCGGRVCPVPRLVATTFSNCLRGLPTRVHTRCITHIPGDNRREQLVLWEGIVTYSTHHSCRQIKVISCIP